MILFLGGSCLIVLLWFLSRIADDDDEWNDGYSDYDNEE